MSLKGFSPLQKIRNSSSQAVGPSFNFLQAPSNHLSDKGSSNHGIFNAVWLTCLLFNLGSFPTKITRKDLLASDYKRRGRCSARGSYLHYCSAALNVHEKRQIILVSEEKRKLCLHRKPSISSFLSQPALNNNFKLAGV